MATITFYGGGGPYAIANLLGSGIGFYGSSFGSSVAVSEYQTSTYISDSNGTTDGGQINNIKWHSSNSSGSINGAADVHVKRIPNYLATLHINFQHGSAVKTQNSKLYIYDRTNKNNDPSGVTCRVYETIHPEVSQAVDGSGADTWSNLHGSAVVLDLAASPGLSGTSPAGPSTTSDSHSWFCCLSASPNSIGSKTQFGLWFETEYL